MEEKIKGEKFTKIFKKGEAYVSTFYQCNNKKNMFVMHILNLETFKVTTSSCTSYCELFVFCKGPTEQKK